MLFNAPRKKSRKGRAKVRGIKASTALAASYYKELRAIVRALNGAITSAVLPTLEATAPLYVKDAPFDVSSLLSSAKSLFEEDRRWEAWQKHIAEKWAVQGAAYTRRAFAADLRAAYGVDIRDILKQSPRVEAAVNEAVRANIELIKSIPARHFDLIETIIRTGIDKGTDFYSIKDRLSEMGEITDRRARIIARDQTAKLNAAIDQAQQRDIGVTHYIWRTSMDERVRSPWHTQLEGTKHSWDDPPVTNDNGDVNHPGEDYNCRCTAEPVLDLYESLLKEI